MAKYVKQSFVEGHIPTTDILDKIKKATASKVERDKLIPYVEIGYDEAMDLLTLNRGNRDRLESDIEKLSYSMRKGKWRFIGAIIRIDRTFRLIDGQGEMLALALANLDLKNNITYKYKFKFHIQTDLDPDVFAFVDIGRVKSMADALKTAGYNDVNNTAAAVKTILSLEKYSRIPSMARGKIPVEGDEAVSFMNKPANRARFEMVASYTRSILKSKKEVNGQFLSVAQWMAIYFMLSALDDKKGEKFVTMLASGTGFSVTGRDEWVNKCYKRLMKDTKPDGRGAVLKIGYDYKYRYIFRAWNAWVNNEKIGELKIDTTTMEVEMPVNPNK